MTDTIETPTVPIPEPPAAAPPPARSNVLLVTAATVVGVMLVAGLSFGAGIHVGRASAAFGPGAPGVLSAQAFQDHGEMRGQGGPMGGQRQMMRDGDQRPPRGQFPQQPQSPQSQQAPQEDPAQ